MAQSRSEATLGGFAKALDKGIPLCVLKSGDDEPRFSPALASPTLTHKATSANIIKQQLCIYLYSFDTLQRYVLFQQRLAIYDIIIHNRNYSDTHMTPKNVPMNKQ